jgi:competence transcription factor ComK
MSKSSMRQSMRKKKSMRKKIYTHEQHEKITISPVGATFFSKCMSEPRTTCIWVAKSNYPKSLNKQNAVRALSGGRKAFGMLFGGPCASAEV